MPQVPVAASTALVALCLQDRTGEALRLARLFEELLEREHAEPDPETEDLMAAIAGQSLTIKAARGFIAG